MSTKIGSAVLAILALSLVVPAIPAADKNTTDNVAADDAADAAADNPANNTATGPAFGGVQRIRLLPPSDGNPRNSEGDFIKLADGRVLFIYTHFVGGAGDHAQAHLAGRFSNDGGASWTNDDVVIVANEGDMNVMSVSLLRLADGRIALFYARKNSTADCRPLMRISDDEAATWSEPVEIIPDAEIGYYVLNNDRVVQLASGRLVVPLAQHQGEGQPKWTGHGLIRCYYSGDAGKTWQRGELADVEPPGTLEIPQMQEPGLVELADGRLMMFCRTSAGSQYLCYSGDGAQTWSQLAPSEIASPQSPATIERIPTTSDLLLVWNDHSTIAPELRGKRTPLSVAVSKDDGRTWKNVGTLEDNPHGWYCYTALDFVGDHIVLGHCAGDRRHNNGLAETQVTRFPVNWLYR